MPGVVVHAEADGELRLTGARAIDLGSVVEEMVIFGRRLARTATKRLEGSTIAYSMGTRGC